MIAFIISMIISIMMGHAQIIYDPPTMDTGMVPVIEVRWIDHEYGDDPIDAFVIIDVAGIHTGP